MQSITLPKKSKFIETGENSGKFIIEDCYPGYGTTLGNSLRRVLLSSLNGAAATAIKIKGVSHEFSTIEGVLEDVVQIILNVKKLRFKSFSDEPVRLTLKFNGKGEITGKDIKKTSEVEVINVDQVIANSTAQKTSLEMEIEVAKGIGYIPVELQEKRDEIDWISIDAIYTPIKRVNYNVENMRVGKRTDFERIVFEIFTDGSVTPTDAFNSAVAILVNQFSVLSEGVDQTTSSQKKKIEDAGKPESYEAVLDKEEEVTAKEVNENENLSVDELKGLSTRTLNALKDNKITKVKGIIKLTTEELGALNGMGEKGVKEIKKAIGILGLILKNN
ncbi:MAG: DNA-directed RNA polymerase subunit alpha [Candidatus Moranbacteria bacterium GW2011_GWF2_34_56]|nr:MAG: DNA-directed RNA polymerase subunit alpha [Candidatus Moranbacteria bacterium GW2011_GWF1_34_10]KKP64972.1 MAG: DNA-directed RNA polymerase subunit alpha [Candidatus Moranbacteria bacterium GW2011_GWF2_34_56]